MNDDRVTELLGTYRALRSTPEVWREVTLGRVPADDAREQLRGQESAELVDASAAMFSPRSPGQQDADFQAILARVDVLDARSAAASRASRRRTGGAAIGLAAAAALVLVIALRPGDSFTAGYALEFEQQLAEVRGAPASTEQIPRYREDRDFKLRLVPLRAVSGELDAVVFADGPAGILALGVDPVVLRKGVVELSGQPEALGLSPGLWRLTIVVGRPDRLPSAQAAVAESDEGYEVIHARIKIEAAPRRRRP